MISITKGPLFKAIGTVQIVLPNSEPNASRRDKRSKARFTRAGIQGRVMNQLVPTVSAVALAAVVAGTFTIIPGFSDPVDASAPIIVAVAAAPVPVVTGKCAEQHWPYMDADCLRDSRKTTTGQAKAPPRVVNIDRKMAAR